MIGSGRILQLTAAIAWSACAGCSFETAPLFQPHADAGTATLGATKAPAPDARVPAAGASAQTQVDAAPSMGTSTVGMGPGAATSTSSTPPITTPDAGFTVDASTPTTGPGTSSDAAVAQPPADRCEGVGPYALKLSMDVAWDATAGFVEAGRGRAELYALVNVEHVDAQTRALTASGRVCGLTLPTLETIGGCASYQFRFDDALWDRPTLPPLQLSGMYTCDTTDCNLQFDSTSYVMGLHLDDPSAPLPDAGVTMGFLFPDDDGDGQPGVTVDVITQESTHMGSDCSYPGWTQSAAPPMTPAQMMATWRLLLGARLQLMAAVGLGADCRVERASSAVPALDLRAAGCGYEPGSDPASANMSCAEEWRGAIDQSIPHYHVLAAGEAPSPTMTTMPTMPMHDATPSHGTIVQAVKLAPSAMLGCAELRATMF